MTPEQIAKKYVGFEYNIKDLAKDIRDYAKQYHKQKTDEFWDNSELKQHIKKLTL